MAVSLEPMYKLEFLRVVVTSSLMFVLGVFSSHSRIFHSFGDVTITGERPPNFDLGSELLAIEQ